MMSTSHQVPRAGSQFVSGVALQVMNQAMLDFGRNWLAHLRDAGASNILVGVYEAATAAEVVRLGAACLDMSSLIEIDPLGEQLADITDMVKLLLRVACLHCRGGSSGTGGSEGWVLGETGMSSRLENGCATCKCSVL